MSDRYLIWSNEHNAWWRPGEMGYTPQIAAAGRYSLEKAVGICNQANMALGAREIPKELPVSEVSALLLTRRTED